jgi:hypothetical protein
VAAKKTLNAKSLEALGVERLAELLVKISASNAGVKRRLRLELIGAQSPGEAAREIRKRITGLRRMNCVHVGRLPRMADFAPQLSLSLPRYLLSAFWPHGQFIGEEMGEKVETDL